MSDEHIILLYNNLYIYNLNNQIFLQKLSPRKLLKKKKTKRQDEASDEIAHEHKWK